jgi:hypothetical protein
MILVLKGETATRLSEDLNVASGGASLRGGRQGGSDGTAK